ncbi:MAG: class I SAM-dependent methyltransferase [Candidatus Pacearchaeota archaeon]
MGKTKSTIFHDKIAENYESNYSSNYWKFYQDITYGNLKKYLPKKNSLILDAGGGTGFWSRKLAKQNYRLICTDISQKMLDTGVKIAKKEKTSEKIKFLNSDITNMKEFTDNFFDLAIAEGDPVGYCENADKAIKELSRVTKKGKYVIISIDSYFSRLNRMVAKQDFKQLGLLESKHKTSFSDGSYYEHDFTIRELKNLFEKNNLDVIEIIGKLVFIRSIPREEIEEVLSNKKMYKNLLKLELKYNSEPSIIGLSGHIQIVGKKR